MTAFSSWIRDYKPVLTLVYLAALGALCVTGVEAYLHVPLQPGVILVFTGFVFGIYLLNRTTDSDEDILNDGSRMLFYRKKNFYSLMAISILGSNTFYLVVTQKFHWVHAFLLAMGACYSYKLVPWLARDGELVFRRIKEITWLKNLSVAALWGGCVVLIPAFYAGVSPLAHPLLGLIGFGLFVSTFNNTLFDDIRDLAGDRAAKIRTLPIEYGVRFCYGLLIAVDFVWAAALAVLSKTGTLNPAHAVFLGTLAVYPLLYLAWYKLAPRRRTWNGFLAESDLLLFGMGLCLIARQ